MSYDAPMKQFRREMILGFEKRQSLLRHTVTTEHVLSGNEAEFLVVDSGGATAKTRGANGDITPRRDNNTQTTCTLEEWSDLVEKTKFNIFASQGNQIQVMQQTTMAVVNRKMDELIVDALDAATVTWGSAAVATLLLVTTAKTKLMNAFACDANADEIYAVITPAFLGYLMGMNEFTSADFINQKPFEGVSKSMAFNWYGVNWIVNADLPGVGTASAKCFMYNKRAIGHAANVEGLDSDIGYDGRQRKSWCRVSVDMGAVLLQNAGVVEMTHNDSALS